MKQAILGILSIFLAFVLNAQSGYEVGDEARDFNLKDVSGEA